ncbi:MAG TPA: succinate CoA transferase [Bacillota bacterium]|nr:succinate CoA transferase [Bacillota bacterium]
MEKIVPVEEAVTWIEDGMVLGVSGFALFGEPKYFLQTLAERGKKETFKVDLYTGASMGPSADGTMVESDLINVRLPYQANPILRHEINDGHVSYIDQHLSQTSESLRQGVIGPIDYAVVEAAAITEDGLIIPSGSIGNSPIFVQQAKHVIIEVNLNLPKEYEGLHDIYIPEVQGNRHEIPLHNPSDRIGEKGIRVDPAKVRGVILSRQEDSPSPLFEPNEVTQKIADNLLHFLDQEIQAGRLTEQLAPLQSGVGSVANAVLSGMKNSRFKDIVIASEVLQDGVFDLIEAGKVKFAYATAFSLSEERVATLKDDLALHRDKILLRPQEISNHPEIIRRLGIISFNTALEVDIYGNVNSTHLNGTHMMNGIGGSGDFARNARISIFVTPSTAKNGNISTIVPFVSHIDHPNHDIDVIVTEFGYADLRGQSPREIANQIIENCMHPRYKQQARNYFEEAKEKNGGHTPHMLDQAHSWHLHFQKHGTMLFD